MKVSFLWLFFYSGVIYVEVYGHQVLNMVCDTTGYSPKSMTSSSGNARLTVRYQDFFKGMRCIKEVRIVIFGQEVECVTVPCTVGMSGVNLRYQFGSALLIRPDTGTNVFKGLYNLGTGDCLEKTYRVNGMVEKSKGTRTSDGECQTLLRGRNDGRMNGVGSIHIGNAYMGDGDETFVDMGLRQIGTSIQGSMTGGDRTGGIIVNNGVFNGVRRNEVVTVPGFGSRHVSDYTSSDSQGTDTNGKIIIGNFDSSVVERDLIDGLTDLHSGLSEMRSGLQSMKRDFESGKGSIAHVGDTLIAGHGTDIIVNNGIFNGKRRNEVLIRQRNDGAHRSAFTNSNSPSSLMGSPTKEYKSEDVVRGIINRHNKYDEEVNNQEYDDENCDNEDPEKRRKSVEDYEIIHTQKVAVLNGNVCGFKKEGPAKTITGGLFKFTVQRYTKPDSDDCIKLVTVHKKYGDYILDRLKISCEHIDPKTRTVVHIRFDGAIYENPSTYGVTYVVRDGVCVDKVYDYGPKKPGTILNEAACFALTGRTKSERMSGVIPGNRPITPADIDVLNEQIVATLDGSVKEFKQKNTRTTFLSNEHVVQIQEYEKDSQCVKVISIKRADRDDNIEEVKVSCKITEPLITSDEDIDFNYGNVIYMLDRFRGVFVLKDGVCLQRSYRVVSDYTKETQEEVEKSDSTLSHHECFAVTRWRMSERSSDVKLNQNPPPKSLQAPGFMWLLAFNRATEGYAVDGGKKLYSGGAITIQTQDYHKDTEECFRLVILSIRGVEADRFKVSCGPIINANVNGLYARYGRAFIVKHIRGRKTYQAVFNVRKEYCVTRTYTVKWSIVFSNTIEKSKSMRSRGRECENLKQTLRTNGGGPLTIGNMRHSNILSDEYQTPYTSPVKDFIRKFFNGWSS